MGTFVGEYGPARGESPHRLNWNLGTPIQRWGVFFSVNGRLQSGTPYNITTGRDDNGDAIFNDRPAGTPRNSLRGALTMQTDLRISWTVPSQRPNGSINFQRGGGGGGGGGGAQGPRGGPGGRGGGPAGGPNARTQVQRRFEMYLFVTNVFNRVNRTLYVGVLTSPYFGRATSAQAPRRMELGWRYSF